MYCEYHTGKYSDLLVYFKLVNYAHDTFGGFGWRTYDELFRAEMSRNPNKPWTGVDNNLWAVHVTKSSASFQEGGKREGNAQSFKKGFNRSRGKWQSSLEGAKTTTVAKQTEGNCSFFTK